MQIIIALILILISCGLIFLSYWIPKKLGCSTTGKYIAVFLTIIIAIVTIQITFEDDLFSKSDAKKLLAKQRIYLKDDFTIEENESMFSPGDAYHTFTLIISNNDKQRFINEIKNSSNFIEGIQSETNLHERENRYSGPEEIKNYETENQFIRDFFAPQGKGYAPIWKKVKIDKKVNRLIFEDIDD